MIRGGLPSDAKERHDARRSAASLSAPTDRSANDPQRRRRVSGARRGDTPFFRTGAGAATLRQTPTTKDISGTSLSILLWSHFVPRHDEWFDKFVTEWGEANGVTTKVDHINTADVPATIAAEIAAGQGHDIVEHIASLAQFEKSVHDLTDVVTELNTRHGEQLRDGEAQLLQPDHQRLLRALPRLRARPGRLPPLALGKGRDAGRPHVVGRLCLPAAPASSRNQGVQMGIGMSNESDSRMAAQTLIWAYGASIQDANENVTINSPETVAAVEYMSQLFKQAMTPEVFGWNAASNNQLLVAGKASYILNSISAYRTAQKEQPEVGADIFFRSPLVGPAGEEAALAHGHAVFISMIPNLRPIPGHRQGVPHPPGRELRRRLQAERALQLPGLAVDGARSESWLDNDPYGSQPADKLALLKTANDWTTNLGHPGPPTPP